MGREVTELKRGAKRSEYLWRSLPVSNINETEVAGQVTNRHERDRDKQRGEERGDTEREDVTPGDVLDG